MLELSVVFMLFYCGEFVVVDVDCCVCYCGDYGCVLVDDG